MSLVNAFGALNLEATQAAVLAELQQKLEPGQSIVVSSVGGTVTVSGTVALDAPTLAALEAIDVRQAGAWTVIVTDGGGSLTVDGTVELGAVTLAALETINAIVSGSVAITNFPATQPVSGTVAVSNFPAFTEIANDVGNPVPVSGTVALSNPGLTDAQLRATPVSVSGTVTITDGAGPVTVDGTVSINQPVAVTDNAGSLTTDGTYDERWSGGKLAASALLNTAGDNTLVTPGAGQSVRLVWISIIPNTDNSAANLITVKFGAGGTPMYLCYAAAHWENFLGGVNVPLVVNLQNAQQVAVTAHYRLV